MTPVLRATCASAVLSLLLTGFTGCKDGNAGNPNALAEIDSNSMGGQPLKFGNLTAHIEGTTQPPVMSSGSGLIVTGIAGATISSLTLTQPAHDLSKTKIVFVSNRDGNYEIYSMNADGSGQTRLTSNPADDNTPVWSPDGTKIVFISNRDGNRDGNYEIYSMNADGTNQTRLTNNLQDERNPSWSPDGTRIIFDSGRDSDGDTYTMNADGTNQTRLRNTPADENWASWSPDGTKIVYTSNQDGNYEIYTMNADGTNQKRLTENDGSDLGPFWSPNGTKIVFLSTRDGRPEVYVMEADGTGETRLTNAPVGSWYSSWSPDGSKIAFWSKRVGGLSQIFSMNADGSHVIQLTTTPGENENPNWPRATTLLRTLIGSNGTLGTTAAGFLYGRNGDFITSLLTFDSAADTRASTRVTPTTGIAGGRSSYSFTISHPTALTSLAYTNDVYGVPSVVIGAGTLTAASNVWVDYNTATGKIVAVIPFESDRAASTQVEGEIFRHSGKLLSVWRTDGRNVAPEGATEVEVNTKTGELHIFR